MAVTKPFFVVPLDLGTITTGNETAGYPAINLKRFKAIGLTWKTTGATNAFVRGDFGSAKGVNFIAIISANALAGTQFRLRLGTSQAAVDGTAGYDSAAQTFISPSITRSDGLYHAFFELPSTQTFQWWRVDITGHTGDFQAAKIVLGTKVTPSRFYNWDFEYGTRDLGDMNVNRFGVFDEEPGVIFRSVAFTLAWQTEAEWETSFRPMIESLGKRGIVYLCFDPTANTYRNSRTYMGIFDKLPFARGVRKAGTYTQDYTILSYI